MSPGKIKSFEKSRYENALTLLNEISGMILEQRDHQDVLEELIRRVARTFNARAGSIAVPGDQGDYLEFVAGFNKEPDLLERLNTSRRLMVNEGVAGRAFANERIYSVSNVFDDDNIYKEKFYEHAERENYRAIFSIPLIVLDTCIGVCTLYFEGERSFDDFFRRIMKPVANQIAIAMLQSDLILDLERSRTRFKEKAETDSLTGLPNHGKLQTTLRDELERAGRYNHTTSCIMVDIDHFKSVNDTYGHPFGDRVLEQLSNFFLEHVRSSDTVGRYGGEEFLFILPETKSEQAMEFAERLRSKVSEMTFDDGEDTVNITISLGVSSLNGADPDAERIIDEADAALLSAKEQGRDRTVAFCAQNGSDTNKDD
jgi:diguanylate cyclase (GGDEF)-like protein